MVMAKQRKPNAILRKLRLERGWSQQRVADELLRLAQTEDENRMPGVNADMVGVWERGRKKPGPYYQTLFCTLFNCSASQLGFTEDETSWQETLSPTTALLPLAPSASVYAQPTEFNIASIEGEELEQALSSSIAVGWKLFLTASPAQVLTIGQAQLHLLQYNHGLLRPQSRPLLYSGIYRLIGAASNMLGNYENALRKYQSAYLAALEAGDPWHMSQNLLCEANTYQALGQYDVSIQLMEQSARLLMYPTNQEQICSKAHILACWSDVAAIIKDKKLAREKLEASAALIEQNVSNEEFDIAHWHQYAGNVALHERNYGVASDCFRKVLDNLSPNWLMRQSTALIALAVIYVCFDERDASLGIAKQAVTCIQQLKTPSVNKQFAEYIQRGLFVAYPHDPEVTAFVEDVQQKLPEYTSFIV